MNHRWLIIMVLVFSFLCPSLYAEKSFEYDPHGRKDPMVPVVDKDGKVLFEEDEETGRKVVALVLQGIIYRDKGVSKAVIDSRLYKVGDKVSGFVIKDIMPDKIILTDGKEDYELSIKKKR